MGKALTAIGLSIDVADALSFPPLVKGGLGGWSVSHQTQVFKECKIISASFATMHHNEGRFPRFCLQLLDTLWLISPGPPP
jgi:hypothetical protein